MYIIISVSPRHKEPENSRHTSLLKYFISRYTPTVTKPMPMVCEFTVPGTVNWNPLRSHIVLLARTPRVGLCSRGATREMQFRDRIVLNVVRGEGKMMPKARCRNRGVNKIQSNSSAPVAADEFARLPCNTAVHIDDAQCLQELASRRFLLRSHARNDFGYRQRRATRHVIFAHLMHPSADRLSAAQVPDDDIGVQQHPSHGGCVRVDAGSPSRGGVGGTGSCRRRSLGQDDPHLSTIQRHGPRLARTASGPAFPEPPQQERHCAGVLLRHDQSRPAGRRATSHSSATCASQVTDYTLSYTRLYGRG